jgi:hypothetical protein
VFAHEVHGRRAMQSRRCGNYCSLYESYLVRYLSRSTLLGILFDRLSCDHVRYLIQGEAQVMSVSLVSVDGGKLQHSHWDGYSDMG